MLVERTFVEAAAFNALGSQLSFSAPAHQIGTEDEDQSRLSGPTRPLHS